MTLHLIGIGYKKEHINFEQLQIIKKSKKVFLEFYTSFYEDDFSTLEKFLDKKIEICLREDIENHIEEKIILRSKNEDISLLVLGDPLIATTHTDLILRCDKLGAKVKVYNNISILNLISKTGLNLYKFGKITSIPFFNDKFMPRTPYFYFLDNHKMGAHTLFLLDLKPDENKYLDVSSSLKYFEKVQKIIDENDELEENDIGLINDDTHFIVCSKMGFSDEKIGYDTLKNLIKKDKENKFKPPLCIIAPGDLNEIEEKYLEKFEK